MPWNIKYTETAVKALLDMDRHQAQQIKKYLDERIAPAENPRAFGHGLTSNLAGLWRYRIGNYRVVVEIQDSQLVVLVVSVGHRSKVYGGH